MIFYFVPDYFVLFLKGEDKWMKYFRNFDPDIIILIQGVEYCI